MSSIIVILEVSGETPAVVGGLGAYCGVAGKPGGDRDLAASKALTASERRRSVGDSTGDLAPSATFCSRIRVGVEQSDEIEAGGEFAEPGALVFDALGGGVKAPE